MNGSGQPAPAPESALIGYLSADLPNMKNLKNKPDRKEWEEISHFVNVGSSCEP